MSRSPFARSLVFALGAAAALLVGAPLLAPAFGERAAVRFLLVAAVVAHAALFASSRSRGAHAAAVAVGLGALVLALPLGVRTTALAAAVLLGVCRSGILFRARPARAALLEGLLLGGGLAIAAFLAVRGSPDWRSQHGDSGWCRAVSSRSAASIRAPRSPATTTPSSAPARRFSRCSISLSNREFPRRGLAEP